MTGAVGRCGCGTSVLYSSRTATSRGRLLAAGCPWTTGFRLVSDRRGMLPSSYSCPHPCPD